jgi:hypothetical protein
LLLVYLLLAAAFPPFFPRFCCPSSLLPSSRSLSVSDLLFNQLRFVSSTRPARFTRYVTYQTFCLYEFKQCDFRKIWTFR